MHATSHGAPQHPFQVSQQTSCRTQITPIPSRFLTFGVGHRAFALCVSKTVVLGIVVSYPWHGHLLLRAEVNFRICGARNRVVIASSWRVWVFDVRVGREMSGEWNDLSMTSGIVAHRVVHGFRERDMWVWAGGTAPVPNPFIYCILSRSNTCFSDLVQVISPISCRFSEYSLCLHFMRKKSILHDVAASRFMESFYLTSLTSCSDSIVRTRDNVRAEGLDTSKVTHVSTMIFKARRNASYSTRSTRKDISPGLMRLIAVGWMGERGVGHCISLIAHQLSAGCNP